MLLQRFVAFFFSLVILMSTSGVAFHIHWCKGEIASFASVFQEKQVCAASCHQSDETVAKACCAKEKETKSCCEDTLLKADVDDWQYVFHFWALQPRWNAESVQKTAFFEGEEKAVSSYDSYYHQAHAPPLYQLYHTFLFYDC